MPESGFTVRTYQNHGFDHEDARFIQIDMRQLVRDAVIGNDCSSHRDAAADKFLLAITALGMVALEIDEHDYGNLSNSDTRGGIWFICKDPETVSIFNLKYKNYVCNVMTQEAMSKLITWSRRAHQTWRSKDRMKNINDLIKHMK